MLPETFTTTRDLPASVGVGEGAESIEAIDKRGMTLASPASCAFKRTSLSV